MLRTKKPGIRAYLIGCALVAGTAAPAYAHHSRAPFDLKQTVTVSIVIDRVVWKNPHIYVIGQQDQPTGESIEWVFEGHSIAGLKRLGWNENTLTAGDRITVAFNPRSQQPDSDSAQLGLIDNVVLENGTKYYAFRVPSGEEYGYAESRDATAPSHDFSGTWSYQRQLSTRLVGAFQPPKDWPLTPAGQKQVEQFDLDESPALKCQDRGLPAFIPGPYGHRWMRDDTQIKIIREQSDSTRVIHLDRAAGLPTDYVPSPLGYSVGHIDDNSTLTVSTTGIAGTFWGNAFGVDSSDQQVITERYTLTDGGFGMQVEYTLTDPVYLTEPVTLKGTYKKQSDYEFVVEGCEAESASLHLQYERSAEDNAPQAGAAETPPALKTGHGFFKLLAFITLGFLGLLALRLLSRRTPKQ